MSVEHDLILASARLARSAPESWQKFLGALQAYSSQQLTNCVQSPLPELQRAQGRAQIAAHIYGILSDCLASADKIEGKRK